ncbi:MAG: N-acetylmuramoyl-L-alanine amidase [Proteobacteria bacterium]|nr:N-acetylmuramoyl-L-alanine amidase [Pseudomonadota bacterium]MBU1686278.1 N-acetylmuramoyl-L-alanine amidase [Pseudomonadota bacterium]
MITIEHHSRIIMFALVITMLFALGSRAADSSPDEAYRQAKQSYQQLSKQAVRNDDRQNWLSVAGQFKPIYRANPDHQLAPGCLYMMAKIYCEMYDRFKNPLDLGEALAYYQDITNLYPEDRLADDALFISGSIFLKQRQDPELASRAFERVLDLYPLGDMVPAATRELAKLKKNPVQNQPILGSANIKVKGTESPAPPQTTGRAKLMSIRHWSNGSYTRVVIETSSPVNYTKQLLRKTADKPRRLFIDLKSCRIDPELQKPLPIDDGLLRRVRSGQYTADTVRVVLDTLTLEDYKIFSLQDPFRIVIDVSGQQLAKQELVAPVLPDGTSPSLAQQLGLGIRRVILDPGHGGKDSGARGIGGLKEKDVVLKVARLVRDRLKRELGCEVVMTRDSDIFIPLEERTAIANTKAGDLFVSIHVNAAPTKKARGIETYILDLARTKSSMQVAARENAGSAGQISDLQNILADLIQNSKKNESVKLAEYVQESLVSGLSRSFSDIKNLGVKRAPFVVLLGAQMPSILAEISFISNPVEADRLKSDKYLGQVADQMVSGVSQYANDLNLASLR